MQDALSRRRFLFHSVSGISATWIATHWPAALAAAQHAHNSAQSAAPPGFEFFTPDLAAEVAAVAARIIPTDETPGAREAGVVYFIDRALATFARDDRKLYAEGMTELQARAREMFPVVEKFSVATAEQQDEILRSLDKNGASNDRPFRSRPLAQNFFETLRQHTIAGFLIDPDSDLHGNREGVGWRVIGREGEHVFQPPFGYYDKDYRGWQPAAADPEKK
ncbi:MAG TPA: gluconate 2-dehydrogenase subunit 3 family protein [Candidatus Dormibacteraeota bacterium]|nr:gluconate 2-dehydrogenase subunit 3 family protein [Candidatus Dormibacteraeota bacterium]